MRTIYCLLIGLYSPVLSFAGLSGSERPTTLTVDCPLPVTLKEGSAFDTTVTGVPKVTANTGGKVTISYLEVYQKGDCKNRADLVTRIFTITNAAGEQVRCNQFITLQHLTVNDIRIPVDTTIDYPDSLSSLTVKLLHIPKSLGSVKINFFDTRISENCNIPLRIRRQWSIEDVCTGQVRTGTTFMYVHKYFNNYKQIISKSDAVCEEEGFITLSAVGEFAPYSYRWHTGDSVAFLFDKPAGSYTLTITDRFNCTASVVYDLLSMSQRADIGGLVRNDKGYRVTPDSVLFENEGLIRKFCISENAGLHYGFTLKNRTPGLYKYRMVKNSQVRDGISTRDIVLIQRHILQLERFADTAQVIAADVNFNGQLTAADITEIRRIILGVREQFTSAKPWYFLRQDWRNVAKPYRPISEIEFQGIQVNNFPLTNVNVFALKMGDVDLSYRGFGQHRTEERASSRIVTLETGPPQSKGTPVYLQSSIELTGLQFALKNLNGTPLEVGEVVLPDAHVYAAEGQLNLSWTSPEPVRPGPDQIVFYVKTTHPEELALGDFLGAECYDATLTVHALELKVRKDGNSSDGEVPGWFGPNPTSDLLTINLGTEPGGWLVVYGPGGRNLARYRVENGSAVPTQHLPCGVYLLRLVREGLPDRCGKLVVN